MSPEYSRQFDQLSHPDENLKPLTAADIDITAMRSQLLEAGLNLEITEAQRASLAEIKFRNLETGRGVGMTAVLGQPKAEALLVWCQQRSEDGPRLKKAGQITEGSEGRGLRQLAADIIQLVVNPKPSDDDLNRFCLRTNQRVMKGLLWESRGDASTKEKIHQAFSDVPDPESTFSSVPSGSVSELWDFLTTPNQG